MLEQHFQIFLENSKYHKILALHIQLGQNHFAGKFHENVISKVFAD